LGTGLVKIAVPIVILMGVWILITLVKTILFAIAGKVMVASLAEAALVLTRPDWAFIIILCCLPYAIWVGFNMVVNEPVPGANDNLSGVAVAFETLKYFAKPENRLENVELWAIAFGSEEGGMLGSKTMANDVKKALEDKTFPAESVWIVSFDSIGAKGPLQIATKEPLYRVKSHSPDVYNQLAASAKTAGVAHYLKSLTAGTDSAPFSRLGIPAVGIVAMGDGKHPANWHSPEDIPEKCDVEGIINSIKMSIQFVRDVDESLEKSK
jgi:acetylornithine deacetylase/succinyl-diaminopimelate desuccinylase-like protein